MTVEQLVTELVWVHVQLQAEWWRGFLAGVVCVGFIAACVLMVKFWHRVLWWGTKAVAGLLPEQLNAGEGGRS
jgi:hypothetical protein